MKTTKPKIKKEIKPDSEKGKYNLNVFLNGKIYNCDTDDIKEALIKLAPEVTKITTKVIVTVTEGEKKFERMLFGVRAKQLFINNLSAELFAKAVQLALK